MDMFVDVCVSKNQIRYKNPVLLWSTIAYTAADYVLILILISHIICLGCTMLDWKNYQQQLRFFFLIFIRNFQATVGRNFQMETENKMAFCYQNCSDLLWEKKCSSDREKLLKFEAEGREFTKCLRLLEHFIHTVKGQKNFW